MDTSADRNPVEALAEEFIERQRSGESPTIDEYCERHPELADHIRQLFPALMMMEDFGKDDPLAVSQTHMPSAIAQSDAPQAIGDYLILREVGRGGMGVVYEAEQQSLSRRVALKVLPGQMLADSRQVLRFEREARSAARLHHTNIVPVFGVGNEDGNRYYVMQFIQGQALDEVLDELKRLQQERSLAKSGTASQQSAARSEPQPAADVARSLMTGDFSQTFVPESDSARSRLPSSSTSSASFSSPRVLSADSAVMLGGSANSAVRHSDSDYWKSVARIGIQVGSALEYANTQGVLHRDIKPSNLMLDLQGRVWVTDFGLAKASDGENLTHTGDIIGTLRYMAPERFRGQCDLRSDLYSLGLTLFELIAFRPAFHESDRNKLIQQLTQDEAPPLRRIVPGISRDLDTIIHKATARDPADRYQDAAAFVADLELFVNDKPIATRRISSAERLWRWGKRNPHIAGLLVTLSLIFLVGFGLVAAQWRRAEAAHETADSQRLEAQDNLRESIAQEQRARENTDRAKRETQAAEAAFAQAQAAVNEYFQTVFTSPELANEHRRALRRNLLESALPFYEQLLAGNAHSKSAAIVARAWYNHGLIHREVHDDAAAEDAFSKAIRLLDSIDAEDEELLVARADCLGQLGQYERATTIWERLCQPDNRTPHLMGLARTHSAWATELAASDQRADARRHLEQALELYRQAADADSDNVQAQFQVGNTLAQLADLQADEQTAEALKHYAEGLEWLAAAARRDPETLEYGRVLAMTYHQVARINQALQQMPQALTACEQAIRTWNQLDYRYPAVPQVSAGLVLAYCTQAQMLAVDEENADRAAAAWDSARDVLERQPDDFPDQQYRLAVLQSLCADTLQSALTAAVNVRSQQSDDRDSSGTSETEDVPSSVPGWAAPAQLRAAALAQLQRAVHNGFRDRTRLQLEPALAGLRALPDFNAVLVELESERLRREQLRLDSSLERNLREMAETAQNLNAIVNAQINLKQFDDARTSLDQLLQLRQELRKSDPENQEYQMDLATSQLQLGMLYQQQGNWSDAEALWKTATQAMQRLVDTPSTGTKYNNRYCIALQQIGRTYAQHFLWQDAAAYFQRAVQRLNDYTPTNNSMMLLEYAPLALRGQGLDAYQEFVGLLLERGGDLQLWHPAGRIAIAGGLGPAPQSELGRLEALARLGFQQNETFIPARRNALAAILYREGKTAEAIAQLTSNVELASAPREERIKTHLLLALTQQQEQQEDQARESLKLAQELIREHGETLAATWRFWLYVDILRQEAEFQVLGETHPAAIESSRRFDALMEMGRIADAKAEIDHLLQLDPENLTTRISCARMALRLNLPEELDNHLEAIRQALSREPSEQTVTPQHWSDYAELLARRAAPHDLDDAIGAYGISVAEFRKQLQTAGLSGDDLSNYRAASQKLAQLLNEQDRPDEADRERLMLGGTEWAYVLPPAEFRGHTKPVLDIAVSRDGRLAVSTADDKTLRIWDLQTGSQLHRFSLEQACVKVRFVANDQQILAADPTSVRLFDLEQGIELRNYLQAYSQDVSLAVSADGQRFARVVGSDVWVWTLDDEQPLQTLSGSAPHAEALQFLPDGRLLAALRNGDLAVWDTETGELQHSLGGHMQTVRSIAVSPDGRQAATSTATGELILWDLDSATQINHTPSIGDLRRIGSLRFLPETRLLIVAAATDGTQQTLIVWDAGRQREQHRIPLANLESGNVTLAAAPNRFPLYQLIGYPDGMVRRLVCPAAAESQTVVELFALALESASDADISGRLINDLGLWETAFVSLAASHPEHASLEFARLRSQLANVDAGQVAVTAPALIAEARELFASLPREQRFSDSICRNYQRILAQGQSDTWQVLRPHRIQVRGQTQLQTQRDGSILASGDGSQDVVYSLGITLENPVRVLRLEVLPHASLPNHGPGRHPTGNFHLMEVDVFAIDSKANRRKLQLEDPEASYSWPNRKIEKAVDGDLGTEWHVWGRLGRAHSATFRLNPVPEARDRLIVELTSKAEHQLGCFRLSAAIQDRVPQSEALLAAASRMQSARLALGASLLAVDEADAACEVLADELDPNSPEEATRLLLLSHSHLRRDDSESAKTCLQQFLRVVPVAQVDESLTPLAIAALQQLEFFAAEEASQAWTSRQRLAALTIELNRGTTDPAKLLERSRLYARFAHWRQSAEDMRGYIELKPLEQIQWVEAASRLVAAGMLTEYNELRADLLEAHRNSTDPLYLDCSIKVYALLPAEDAGAELPLQTLEELIVSGDVPSWFPPYGYGALALAAYRANDLERAEQWTTLSFASETATANALKFAVRALVRHKLGKPEWQEDLSRVKSLIPPELPALLDTKHAGTLPVPYNTIHHDWMIAQILVGELEAKVAGE